MKTNNTITLLAMIMFIFITSCSGGECHCADCYANVDQTAVEAEISAINDALQEHMISQDIDGYIGFYADNAISNPPGRPALDGKAAIRADLETMWAEPNPPGMAFEFNGTDMWVLGDHVLETGTFSFSMDGMDEPATGKYVNVFQKIDGKYQCIRDMWNYDSMPDMEETEEEMYDSAEAE